ncbi:hypothetical protein KDM41_08320 [bacterium]|nr:hypothetical protein [bacterium]
MTFPRPQTVAGVLPAGLVLAALLAAALLPTAGAHAEPARVANGPAPADGTRDLELTELWRRGGLEDEDVIFGLITAVRTDADGTVYVLDSQLSEIKVFTPDGELSEILGREGDGPGEFRGPADMALLPDGTLGVLQAFPGRVVRLNRDGTEAGKWTLGDPAAGAFYIMRGLKTGGDVVVAGGTQQHIDQSQGLVRRETFLSSLGADGLRDVTYSSRTFELKFQELRFDEKDIVDGADQRYDVGPDGRVVVAIPRNGYEVSVFAPDGTLERVFTREYDPWVRDARAEGIWRRIMEGIQAQQPGQAPVSWEQTEPDVENVRVAADGRTWILTSRGMWTPPAGVFARYDVFSPAGNFVEQVDVRCEGDPTSDVLIWAGPDRVLRVTGFWGAILSRFGGGAGAGDDETEAEPMSIVCYEYR